MFSLGHSWQEDQKDTEFKKQPCRAWGLVLPALQPRKICIQVPGSELRWLRRGPERSTRKQGFASTPPQCSGRRCSCPPHASATSAPPPPQTPIPWKKRKADPPNAHPEDTVGLIGPNHAFLGKHYLNTKCCPPSGSAHLLSS